MGSRVLIGTCGFQKSRKTHYNLLDVVEIQQTFYDPPPAELLKRWRDEAPPNFEFTVKAWMLITHEYNKKLWSRLKREVPGKISNYGHFKPTEEIQWAWRETLKATIAVDSKIVVFQTPASFKPDKDKIDNLINFMNAIKFDVKKHNLLVAWEPRGEWWSRIDLLDKLSREYDILIVSDLLRGKFIEYTHRIAYMRLHGLGPGEVNYKYKYTENDLLNLKQKIIKLKYNKIYILFNNIYAFYNAVEMKNLIEKAS